MSIGLLQYSARQERAGQYKLTMFSHQLTLLWFLAFLSASYSALDHCPCASISRIDTGQDDYSKSICLSWPAGQSSNRETKLKKYLSAYNIEHYRKFKFIEGSALELSNCLLFIQITRNVTLEDYLKKRVLCPDSCYPLPKASVMLEILTIDPFYPQMERLYSQVSLSCSLHLLDAIAHYKSDVSTAKSIHWSLYVLLLLANRKAQECSEHWNLLQEEYGVGVHDNLHSSSLPPLENTFHLPRRKVQGIVIWIGNADRYDRLLNQHEALREASFHNDQAVLGWGATDRLYPCKEGSTKCLGGNQRYAGMLPKSDVNYMSSGWGCAQRRPLRTLSHVLSLFDPTYLLLLDDDTFLNFPLLQSRYMSLINSNLSVESSYMGEAMGKTGEKGHISTVGFFVGGSGYLMGKNVIDKLVSKEIPLFGFESAVHSNPRLSLKALWASIKGDEVRSKYQAWHLSLVGDALRHSLPLCPKSKDSSFAPRLLHVSNCLNESQLLDKEQQSVGIGVRLVDFCVNMMANDNACQHSDHSLGRCLVFGAKARPVPVICHDQTNGDKSKHIIPAPVLGMCFMTPKCDLERHVTCHRYEGRYNEQLGKFLPHKTMPRSPNTYKHHSSVFDGNMTDSYV